LPTPSSPSAPASSVVSLGTTAPVGEKAGAVVLVEPGVAVGGEDVGRVVVVDRPDPPEDGRDVLVVEPRGPVVVVEGELDVVVAPASSSSAGSVVVVGEGSVVVVVVVVGESGDDSVVGVVSTVVDVVALPPPGSEPPRSATADPVGTQTATTHSVVRAIARRVRLSITRVSWVRGNGNAVDHIGAERRSSPLRMFQNDDVLRLSGRRPSVSSVV
jgi:hypothetical protein